MLSYATHPHSSPQLLTSAALSNMPISGSSAAPTSQSMLHAASCLCRAASLAALVDLRLYGFRAALRRYVHRYRSQSTLEAGTKAVQGVGGLRLDVEVGGVDV